MGITISNVVWEIATQSTQILTTKETVYSWLAEMLAVCGLR